MKNPQMKELILHEIETYKQENNPEYILHLIFKVMETYLKIKMHLIIICKWIATGIMLKLDISANKSCWFPKLFG